MLRELLSIFSSGNPLKAMADNFAKMLGLSHELTLKTGAMYFEKSRVAEDRTWVYKTDVAINKLERVIRKQVIAHLAVGGNSASLPYCLALMSLVKDIERIGDYAKNLAEVVDFSPAPLPDDDQTAELREIRSGVEIIFAATAKVIDESDDERALELIHQGRDLSHRADVLVTSIAQGDYDAGTAAGLVLGARYFKRIAAHVTNVLTSVVMPLHKLDYYDEDEIIRQREEEEKGYEDEEDN
jgi:phosphate uptake regulator